MRRTITTALAVLAITSTLSGCAFTIPLGADKHTTVRVPAGEAVYQIFNAVDMATTVNIARRPDCYREVGYPTANLIGEHPSVRNVELYWAADATLHAIVSTWLNREAEATGSKAWRAAYATWQIGSAGLSAYVVAHNLRDGLRPFGAQCGNATQDADAKRISHHR